MRSESLAPPREGAELLPDSIGALAAVIGWPAALRLAEVAAGLDLDIAERDTPTMILIGRWLGEAARQRLAAAYGGQTFYVPFCADQARAERDRRLREQVQSLERTMTTREAVRRMAREWRMSERNIWRRLSMQVQPRRRPAADDRQLALI